ncbi:MAG: DUF1269 domain-containing protein [Chloroflexi bacterium]|nr:DUF1269 domain-containing protein [Chloroflexota bacterium]MBV9601494.1 DUF1269 domain-containing protein [Chloroflexota bacterium]
MRVAADGTYKVALVERQGASDALWGVLWGAMFGLVVRVPLAGTEYRRVLGGLCRAIDRAGCDAKFGASVQSELGPLSPGLAVLVQVEER